MSTYVPADSRVHSLDARVKVVLLFAYTITLFWVETWVGLGLFAALFVGTAVASQVEGSRYALMGIPVYALAAFTVLFACFNPAVGLLGGCFSAIRMILLVQACLVVTFTTTSNELTDALRSFLTPLRTLRVPVDDVAMVFSLAIRFIPLSAQELCRAHDAQLSRGARFSGFGLIPALSAWATVFVSLFVNLFRRADKLSVAMEARCYGMTSQPRTALVVKNIGASSVAVLVVGISLVAGIAAVL